jgi:integrase
VNAKRAFFVDRVTTQKLIDHCPDSQWRLIIGLCRYAGLGCPSELVVLNWSDINWPESRMTVTSSKKKDKRVVPIFGELRPYLEDALALAEPGAVHVITRYRSPDANLRTTLEKIIERAGLKKWPRPFQNLRASCETELADRFPIKTVTEWIGNSEAVARAHYMMVTEDHFAAAIAGSENEKSGATGGAAGVGTEQQGLEGIDATC